MDKRYDGQADRIGGASHPASLIYINLSDDGGPLRAVLRVSRHVEQQRDATSSDYGRQVQPLTPNDEHTLTQLAPLFSLALRHAARKAAADPTQETRARAVESLSSCISTLADEAKAGEVGGVMEAFGREAVALLNCDAATMYLIEETPQKRLVQLPADTELDPRYVSLDPKNDSGISGLCATTRQTYNVEDGKQDKRLHPSADAPYGEGAGFIIGSALCMPIDSGSSGGECAPGPRTWRRQRLREPRLLSCALACGVCRAAGRVLARQQARRQLGHGPL